MTTQYHHIVHKHRQNVGMLASLADFTCRPGPIVDPAIIRERPNISLYCLDDVHKYALFVELPPDIDLSKAPFVYQAQYEHAYGLISVPYDTFREQARFLPPINNLIMVYITGRSGSTLLSHLFNELDAVVSLSEPDVATQFVHMRTPDGQRDAELRELLDCSLRFLFKPTPTKQPSTCALKLRGEGVQVMDLYQATFPQARNLFLYRDAIGWAASWYRVFRREPGPESMPLNEYLTWWGRLFNYDITHLAAYLDEGATQIGLMQQLTLWWLMIMEWYLTKYELGIPILPVRYADLNANREQVVSEVFEYCGLPTSSLASALCVFGRDAQAGTPLARENPQQGNTLRLSDEQRKAIMAILQRHPVINDADYVAPSWPAMVGASAS